ncbi:DUF6705 family protein [Flavobacterium sasangense]|uniref:DUF6705 family protein n=1 Tax=Flavobacterium sasangense TaxID=503361 RepID=UPI000479ACAB|nr:DUF6705 family protein [Flavobacterium sasangense]
MKKIAFYLLICFVSLTAQAQTIKPLSSFYTGTQNYSNDDTVLIQPVYYKDTFNHFTPFIGSWKYVEGNKTFIVTLYKVTKKPITHNNNVIYYMDYIFGYYRLVENYGLSSETEIYNSQDLTGNRPAEINSISPTTTYMNIEFRIYDVVGVNYNPNFAMGMTGDLKITINNSTSPLTAQWTVTPIYEKWYKEGEPNSFVVPTNIVLIKM